MDDENQIRQCSKCGESKALSAEFFNRDARLKSGFVSACKSCKAEYLASYYKLNTDKCKANTAKHRKEKPEEIVKRNAAYREANLEKALAWNRASWHKNKANYLKVKKSYKAKNRDAIRIKNQEYALKNQEKITEKCVAWAAEKRRTDPMFRVRLNIGRAIRHRLFKGAKSGRHVFELLGYSPDALKLHLEKQFLAGMTWENYGDWHIDHIVPCVNFKVKEVGDSEFMACWSLNNLRPLWAVDNFRKKDSLIFLL